MSISDTFHKPLATAPKQATLLVSSDPERTGQVSLAPKVSFDQAPAPSTNPPPHAVQQTAENLPPLSFSGDRAARYKALSQDAQTAGGAVSIDFSGSTSSSGGKLTRKIIATQKITENVNNSLFMGDKGITELRDAPNIDVTHKEVTYASLCGSIKSQTKATENATIKMANTITTAVVNLAIDQQATKILNVSETNTKTYAGNDSEVIRKAEQVVYVVNGQQMPDATPK